MTAAESYSDNIHLSSPGYEQSSFVTEIAPQLFIRGTGRRLNLGFDYNLQTVYRSQDGQADIFHQFAGNARTELLRDWLFLDFVTTYDQENILATDLGADNIANRGNRTNVFTYAASPFLAHRFSTRATAEARFTYEGVDNSETFDTISNNIDFQVWSGTDFQRTPWQVFYQRQKNIPSEGESSEFLRTGIQLGYQFTSQIEIFTSLGYETNDFLSSQPESERNGFSGTAGVVWTPARRVRIEGGYSKRPFGDGFFADLRYRGSRTTWQANYREDFTTTTQSQLEQQAALVRDSVTVEADEVPVPTPSLLIEEVFLSRRLQGSLDYIWRRSDATLSLYAEERSFETRGDEERVYGGALATRRALFRNNTLGLAVEMQRIRESLTSIDNTFWRAGLQLSRAINRYLTCSFDYSYQKQQSDVATDDYTENRITLSVTVGFQPTRI